MKEPYKVIKTVRITEKGTILAENNNQYQLSVDRHANKLDVKHAVERLFKVKVIRVNTMKVRGKARRQRTAQAGVSAAWKKAIVTLRDGDKIELT